MATPVAHYLVGYSVAQAFARNDTERRQAFFMGAIAIFPDLDVLPGLLVGNLGQFHQGASHSILGAVAFSIAGSIFFMRARSKRSVLITLVLFLVYASHLLIDSLTLDRGAPIGIPLFWPFSSETYQFPWLLLPNVQHTSEPLISVHNVLLAIRELFIFLPMALLIYTLRTASLPWHRSMGWLFGSWFLVAMGLSFYTLR